MDYLKSSMGSHLCDVMVSQEPDSNKYLYFREQYQDRPLDSQYDALTTCATGAMISMSAPLLLYLSLCASVSVHRPLSTQIQMHRHGGLNDYAQRLYRLHKSLLFSPFIITKHGYFSD